MDINMFMGLGRADTSKKRDKTKRHVKMSVGEANHMIFLGKSGYGKTTLMRGLVEEINIAHNMAKIPAMIIVLEKKTDHTKAEKIHEIYNTETEKSSDNKIYKKYGEWVWNYIENYIQMQNQYKEHLGMMGDFAFGVPNIIGKFYKYDDKNTFLGRQGLQPYVFPTRRFVFRPRRRKEYISMDNGWHMCKVFDGKIPYDKIPFSLLSALSNLGDQAIYAQRLKNIWEVQGIKDPSIVKGIALEYENNKSNPSATYLRIAETMYQIKNDKLFSKKDTLFTNLSTDAINVIDFSSNSDLTHEEECLIFKFLVMYAINHASQTRTPIYFVVDEVQNMLTDKNGQWAVDKILREGRSMGINLITATQYMYGLPQSLLMGASHVGIIGRLASHTDWKVLNKLIDDFEDSVEPPDPVSTYTQYEDFKKKMKFKGWFSWDKSYTDRIEFRQPQSL
ncbi:Cdc6-like AAA superfamily ATPase [Methanococcus voltae PS]|uniref:Cdc6-like AAA superfamily ATPase n=1 Tax=Methanococcus voltae PS TaxID=523842 RepID=A0ABT2EYM2_METVO|nr:type IV secretory system conjugative DNA transfer family protein [Methanococcus voltae]MCS3922586.1 Cdc6-like AAA superfamily ATPase [Methanococcus voltae PS]